MVAICIWCALFVTSNYDVICFQTNVLAKLTYYAYSSTRTPLNLCVIELNIIISAPGYDIGVKYTHRHNTAVLNCENIGLCVKTGE